MTTRKPANANLVRTVGPRPTVPANRHAPAAPPAYRPQPIPKVLQTKQANGSHPGHTGRHVYKPKASNVAQPKITAALPNRKQQVAPPVYKPQPTPLVLQRKTSQPVPPQGHRAAPIHVRASQAGGLVKRMNTLQPAIRPPYAGAVPPAASPRSASTQVVQRLKKHAEQYVNENKLNLKVVSYENVNMYVNNPKQPKEHRLGLLKKWNQGMKSKGIYRIPIPGDLVTKEVPTFSSGFDFSNYDSDDDDQLVIKDSIKKNQKKKVTLKRKDREFDVPVLDFTSGLKIGRQMVKQGLKEHSAQLPFVLELGGQMLEFDSPYKNDIYCYGLVEGVKGYKRAGNNESFNWKNLADQLEGGVTTAKERLTKKLKIFNAFSGKLADKLSSDEAEAVGAIGCDFIKGMGNYHFLEEALKAKEPTFKDLFAGPKPLYEPAVSLGRKLATIKTKYLKTYRPNQAQTDYLSQTGKAIRWIRPDGRCVFGSLAHIKGITTEAAIQATKLAIQRGEAGVLDVIASAALQLGESEGTARRLVWQAIVQNDWANPRIGDYIINIAAAALGIGVTILMPDANRVNINGGGHLIVKVTQPLEHYHATQNAV